MAIAVEDHPPRTHRAFYVCNRRTSRSAGRSGGVASVAPDAYTRNRSTETMVGVGP